MSTAPGVYRGICTDNVDPLGLGRIRVQVPQVMGPSVTGWALPAWSLHDLTVWPQDRVPKAGVGVWVLFEGPDRLTWIAIYGEQEFVVADSPALYVTDMEWEFPGLPEEEPADIQGTLLSAAGPPNPLPRVWFRKAPLESGPWEDVLSAPVDPKGVWEFQYSRPAGEIEWWYRTDFEGHDPFTASTTGAVKMRNTATTTTWTVPSPLWQKPVAVAGQTKSVIGLDVEGRTVELRIKRNNVFVKEVSALTDADGLWSMNWTRKKSDTAALEIKAVHVGDPDLDRSETPVAVIPKVQVPVLLTWSVPPFTYNVPASITGTIWTAEYGIPAPSTLQFWRKTSWADWEKAVDVYPGPTGAWQFTYTSLDGEAEYAMVYPGYGPWAYAETPHEFRTVSTGVTVTAPTLPTALVRGTAFQATGKVTYSGGKAVTEGQVALEWRYTYGSDLTWKQSSAPNVGLSGTGGYTFSHPALTVVGPTEWRVKYLGTPAYLPGTSAATAKTVNLSAPVLSTGTIGHTNASMSWTAVAGAAEYEVHHRQSTGAAWAFTTTTGLTESRTGYGYDTNHYYQVRARVLGAAGTWIYGAFSNTISGNTGHPEVWKSSNGDVGREQLCTASGSWSEYYGWSAAQVNNRVYQGYYTNANVSWYGVMTYDYAGFQNWVRANWGQDVLDNFWATHTFIYMKRVGDKDNGPGKGDWSIYPRWYVTDSLPNSGGRPALAGGDDRGGRGIGDFYYGNADWVELQAHWGKHVLRNENLGGNGGVYTSRSLALYYGGTYHYGAFAGPNDPGFCKMHFYFQWHFLSVAGAAAKWN